MPAKLTPPDSSDSDQKPPDRHGFRGVPPPPTFSLATLPDDMLLDKTEVAGFLRVSIIAVEKWIEKGNHALPWIALPGGFWRCRAGDLRTYIASGSRRIRGPNKRKPAAPNALPAAAPMTQNARAKRKRTRRTAARNNLVEAAE